MNQFPYSDVEDFLIDNTFQSYCSEDNAQCMQYWEKYIAAHPEQLDTILKAKRLYHILAGHKKPVHKELAALRQTILAKDTAGKSKQIPWKNILKIAAVVSLMGFGYMWYSSRPEIPSAESPTMSAQVSLYKTKKGEKKVFELPDGTKVTLNSESSLAVEDAFNSSDRQVSLIGEGFFEVAKDPDKPFILHTNDFDIRVLGTSFNVKSYPDELRSEALLVEGTIEMKSKGEQGNSIIVKPNQKVIVYRNNLALMPAQELQKKQAVKVSLKEIAIQDLTQDEGKAGVADIAWKENRLAIDDQDFMSLKRILERWYDVDIAIESKAVRDYRFTATFSTESITQVLIALQKVQPFKYEINGKKITIQEK